MIDKEGIKLEIYRITDEDGKGMWVEGAESAYDAGASYDKRDDRPGFDVEWTGRGGRDSVMDSTVDEPDSEFTIPSSPFEGWAVFDVKKSVQIWANGGENQGWVIVQPISSPEHYWFSDDAEDVADRPKLIVNYIPPAREELGKPGKPYHIDD
ncbi:hypothetical protein DRP77_11695 [Candidatus Poribacteria bacterium]|nr:MAG: hypothetical protein DRP77_11695 [Candidatus Poribacteria bacterium]